ncbi:MAG: hypothetical protein NC318_04520 [Blautia sp.]|nr:hypothetical protein [Lachnoclostridium sp.]MCM1210845.1 hypothetical protein [Blautia sp.]
MLKKISDSFVQLLFTLLALYLTYLLLRYPAQSLTYANTGLLLWFQKMIPTLLPFMILSGIMVRRNLTERFAKWFHPLFHAIWGTSLNGSYVILIGMLCGFPMGARVIGELCHVGRLSEREGEFLLSFCNNIGPIYFTSFVMGTLSLSGHWAPLLIMYGVPLFYGWIYRMLFYRNPATFFYSPITSGDSTRVPSLLEAVDESIVSGLIGIGKLGGYMVFFNLLNVMLLPFSSLPQMFLALCNCMLEITSGINYIGQKGMFLILTLLPFGGLSCMAQTYSMIKDTNLSLSRYFMHKCIQTAITALIYVFFYASASVYSF